MAQSSGGGGKIPSPDAPMEYDLISWNISGSEEGNALDMIVVKMGKKDMVGRSDFSFSHLLFSNTLSPDRHP